MVYRLIPTAPFKHSSLEYKQFLDKGKPVCFDVPVKPEPVVSGLLLGSKLLVRRTDFDGTSEPVKLRVNGQTVSISRLDGKCQVIDLK